MHRWMSALVYVGAGLDRESWQEFGGASLGDARLSARLVTCARH